jgi:hypothetical protein
MIGDARGQGRFQRTVMVLKSLVALVPARILPLGSVVWFLREKTFACLLQLTSAGGLVVVILADVFEIFRRFPRCALA